MPGYESDKLKVNEDIHVKWTATSGNVSSSTYNA
jgi:6-phosphogluconate dehydrogenase